MRPIVRTMAVLVPGIAILGSIPGTALGATSGGDGPGGTVTVGAGDSGPSGGAPGGSSGGTGPGTGATGSGWTCTSIKLVLNDGGGIAPGGPTPGSWYSVICTNLATGSSVTQTVWIPDQAPVPTGGVDPYSIALQAERSMVLPRPTLQFNPSGTAVVNLPTWLWIGADLWHAFAVTASVGPVSATAVAVPEAVTWTMGDGATVVCSGPGTPYDTTRPASQQSTGCAYTYPVSSVGQPSPDGNPDHGSFSVQATVTWSVTWSAQGASGGGQLPSLSTSTSALMRVQQVESVNAGLDAATSANATSANATSAAAPDPAFRRQGAV